MSSLSLNVFGKTPGLDAVLSLLTEKPERGATFKKFQEKSKSYILKNA